MKQIIFPGNHLQPCEAFYGIFFEKDSALRDVHIVVVQDHEGNPGTSLTNTDEGRENVLNRILGHDLYGVRVDFVRFSQIYVSPREKHGLRFPIHFDIEDYVKRGNPHDVKNIPSSDPSIRATVLSLLGKGDKQYTVHSYNVVGGCARFFVKFEEREALAEREIDRLLNAVGYNTNRS